MKTATATSAPPIETRALSKRFGSLTALDALDLRLERGEVFGLIGPNGAGKTTAMRLLLDILRPSGGDVRVLGTEPRAGGAALRRRIGFLPGELRLQGRATAHALLKHYANLSGPVKPGAVERLAERLGLDLSRQVGKLSKGNKQKVGLVQAFMHEPELLILDEPTSGLDPLVQQEFLAMVREASANGQTVFLSSHVLSEIEQAADRAAILYRGRLVKLERVSALRLSRRRRVRVALRAPLDELRAGLAALPQAADVQLRDADGEVLLNLTLEGEADPLVKLLAKFSVTDLTIAEPVLEEAILDLYRGEDHAE